MEIPYGRHWIDEQDVAAVLEVLRSPRLTQGPEVGRFEQALAEHLGVRHVVVVANGTAALHLACAALLQIRGRSTEPQTGPPEVVTSPITFLASANCVIHCEATPRFVDIEPRTYNLSPTGLEAFLETHPEPERVCGVIPIHFAGQPCDLKAIHEIARRWNLFVLEDACHALGARWQDESGTRHRIGDGHTGDATVFSFHPVKQITSGEGGAIATDSEEIAMQCRVLREHGMQRACDPEEPWRYEMHMPGFNYRITDLQCALGRSQLMRNDAWIERRRAIAAIYDAAFKDIEGLVVPWVAPGREHAYHLYVIQVPERKRIFHALEAQGIGVQVHYFPLHLQPYYRELCGTAQGDFPVAEEFYERALSLPMFPALQDSDVERVIDAVREALLAPGPSVPC